MAKAKKIDADLKFKKFKIEQIKPAKYNPRTITDEAMAGLARSIYKFGCVEPIIVNVRDNINRIVGGHQRYKVLKAAGIKEVICVTVNLKPADEKLLNLSLNNPHIQGEFIDQLNDHIDQLKGQIDEKDFIDLKINLLRNEITDTAFSEDFVLPEGDKEPFETMRFSLTTEQGQTVRDAVEKAKKTEEFVDTGNANKNGNALARICELYLEKK